MAVRSAKFFALALGLVLPASLQAKAVTQASLDAISDKCHLSRSSLVLGQANQIQVRLHSEADQKFIGCVFDEVMKAGYPSDTKIDLIGNAAIPQKAK